MILLEVTKMNQHATKFQEGQQLFYKPIYSLSLVKLKTLKTYIEINLANTFIRPSKSPIGTLTLFVVKPDGSLCLYVDYWGFNTFSLKNWYPLLLIDESLDQLGRAKGFI